MKTSTINRSGSGNIISIIKGVFVALIISLIGILAFALTIKFLGVPQNMIQPINQVIKFVSILLGVRAMFRTSTSKSLLLSILMGAIYTILALVIFSLLSSSFTFSMSMLTDTIFGAIAGFLCGIIVKILAK